MDEREFKRRTQQFALDVIALVDELPRTTAGRAIGAQIVRSGPSVGANYRAACRAKSGPDMIAKLANVEEEADETVYWLELIELSGMLPPARTQPLHREGNEILAMVVASLKTLKGK